MDQAEVFRDVIVFFNSHSIRYAIVGSVAAISYGETRMTAGMDVLAEIRVEHILALTQTFAAPDWYVSDSAVRDAIRYRSQFNIIHVYSGNKVDVILSQNEDDVRTLERAIQRPIVPALSGLVANPNDVISGKLRFYSEGESSKHLTDIASILKVSAEHVDLEELRRRATQLGVLPVWDAILARVRATPPLPCDFPQSG